jgi:hypothetical protein
MELCRYVGRYRGTLGRYMGGEVILARYLGRYKRWVE